MDREEFMEIKTVCGLSMGGKLGETPTLLVGSMFYDRQKIVKDSAVGEFDRTTAKRLLDLQKKWSETTGNPACVDVIASTPEAMRRYLDFVIEHFDGPLMVDGSNAEVKVAGIRHLAECGMNHRAIYNSISPDTLDSELEAIAACDIKSAVLLAVTADDFSASAKIDLLAKTDGLISKTNDCGVEHCLVDPGVIDLPSICTVKAMIAAVRELGCFIGTAPHNAIGNWSGLRTKLGNDFKPAATAVLNAIPVAWGADFVIYGPLSLAPMVFPAVAMVDVILSYSLLDQGKIPDSNHPMFRIA
jgi:tetrahydromethanopterin S-methyltransferase subunit H